MESILNKDIKFDFLKKLKKIKLSELILFHKQLFVILSSGFGIIDSFEILTEESDGKSIYSIFVVITMLGVFVMMIVYILLQIASMTSRFDGYFFLPTKKIIMPRFKITEKIKLFFYKLKMQIPIIKNLFQIILIKMISVGNKTRDLSILADKINIYFQKELQRITKYIETYCIINRTYYNSSM